MPFSNRCDKEEARIKAWEELQTSKVEAEMKKIEVSTVLQLPSFPNTELGAHMLH